MNSTVSSPAASPAFSVQSENSGTSVTPAKIKLVSRKQQNKINKTYLKRKHIKHPEDQLTKFFQSMELSVRSLPPELQIETRRKIFQVVTEAEVAALSTQYETRHQNTSQFQPQHQRSNSEPTSFE